MNIDYKRYLWELAQFGRMIQHKGFYTSEDKAICEFACYLVKASGAAVSAKLWVVDELSKARSYTEFIRCFDSFMVVFAGLLD